MDFVALYELADRELSAGLADEKLLSRSFAEAKGVEALARQIYCELRAKNLERSPDDTATKEWVLSIESQEKRLRTRKVVSGWLWTIACFVGFIGTLVFSWFALSAVRSGARFYPLAFLTLLSFVLTLVALAASRYHSDV